MDSEQAKPPGEPGCWEVVELGDGLGDTPQVPSSCDALGEGLLFWGSSEEPFWEWQLWHSYLHREKWHKLGTWGPELNWAGPAICKGRRGSQAGFSRMW